jgi:hypothetical protein
VRLGPLSPSAVARLAGHCDIDELYELTGGNPFYVTAMLAATSVPPTVQDAVMARVGRLDEAGRACVETMSVVPSRTEQWLLDGCGVSSGIDDAERLGVLRVEANMVSFSHELARRAIEHSLPPGRRRAINRRVLDVLVARDADPARLAHHAAEAADAVAVARYAVSAARRAASLESHREAVEHFQQALRHPERYSPGELADLLEGYARECYLTGRHDRARAALDRVIEMHGRTGDHERLGASLNLLADVLWFLGQGEEAELKTHQSERSPLWSSGCRAERWRGPTPNGRSLRSRTVALTRPFCGARRPSGWRVGSATPTCWSTPSTWSDPPSGSCRRSTTAPWSRASSWRRNMHLEQGHWSEAERAVRRPLDSGDVSRITALRVIGLIQARRGHPDAHRDVRPEAHRLALRSGESRNLVPLAIARAELAWLRGDLQAVRDAASPALPTATESRSGRWIGEAALWLRRAGELSDAPVGATEPYALQVAGRCHEAAKSWESRGRPYERADALAEASDPESLLRALSILDRLAAVPRAAMVRRRLTEMGVSHVPRGPRRAA